jgi:hypothetical protein
MHHPAPTLSDLRRLIVALALTLGGCAPDAWNANSASGAFLDHISRTCPQNIGNTDIETRVDNDAYFIDEVTNLYFGQISRAQFASDISVFYPGENQAAIDCILAKLPSAPPARPKMLP